MELINPHIKENNIFWNMKTQTIVMHNSVFQCAQFVYYNKHLTAFLLVRWRVSENISCGFMIFINM